MTEFTWADGTRKTREVEQFMSRYSTELESLAKKRKVLEHRRLNSERHLEQAILELQADIERIGFSITQEVCADSEIEKTKLERDLQRLDLMFHEIEMGSNFFLKLKSDYIDLRKQREAIRLRREELETNLDFVEPRSRTDINSCYEELRGSIKAKDNRLSELRNLESETKISIGQLEKENREIETETTRNNVELGAQFSNRDALAKNVREIEMLILELESRREKLAYERDRLVSKMLPSGIYETIDRQLSQQSKRLLSTIISHLARSRKGLKVLRLKLEIDARKVVRRSQRPSLLRIFHSRVGGE